VGIAGDGWWYELFGTNLCASAWPAPETVTLYYGRIGQENRFHQEDRELGLDRIFSYNLPGQRLANLIGLFVWNMRIARGAELFEPLPKKILPQEVRSVIAHTPENTETSVCESEDFPPKAMDECPDLTTLPESTEEESEGTPETVASEKNRGRTAAQLFQNGYGPLGALNWSAYLSRLKGWRWDETMGVLCPNDAPLRPHEILVGEDGSIFMRWRSRTASCRECLIRAQCTESKSPIFRREVCFTLDKSETQDVIEYLARVESVPLDEPEPARESAPDIPYWCPTEDENNPGKLRVSAPMLIPSVLRQKFRAECVETQVEVRLTDEQKHQKKKYVFLAITPEERQQRRKTWTWRIKRNQLPATAHVEVVLHGGAKLAGLLNRKAEASNAA
jgi:hypothetical protein